MSINSNQTVTTQELHVDLVWVRSVRYPRCWSNPMIIMIQTAIYISNKHWDSDQKLWDSANKAAKLGFRQDKMGFEPQRLGRYPQSWMLSYWKGTIVSVLEDSHVHKDHGRCFGTSIRCENRSPIFHFVLILSKSWNRLKSIFVNLHLKIHVFSIHHTLHQDTADYGATLAPLARFSAVW